jgi:hypothetical protein
VRADKVRGNCIYGDFAMAHRSSRARSANATRATTSTTSTPASGFDALGAVTQLPQRQLALATHSATELWRGSQELQRIQLEAAQRAFHEATRYWQQVASAALKLQADFVSTAGEAVAEGASEPTFESFQRAFEATLNGAGNAGATH